MYCHRSTELKIFGYPEVCSEKSIFIFDVFSPLFFNLHQWYAFAGSLWCLHYVLSCHHRLMEQNHDVYVLSFVWNFFIFSVRLFLFLPLLHTHIIVILMWIRILHSLSHFLSFSVIFFCRFAWIAMSFHHALINVSTFPYPPYLSVCLPVCLSACQYVTLPSTLLFSLLVHLPSCLCVWYPLDCCNYIFTELF